MDRNYVDFYINSVGSEVFSSLAEKIAEENSDSRIFLIRGGVSESGKFIEEIGASLEKEGIFSQRFLSFYGDETDGVYFPDINTYIFDENKAFFSSTMIDLRYYTVDLGVCGERKMLFHNRFLIAEAMEKEKAFLTKTSKFFSAVRCAGEDIKRLSAEALNTEKTERFISRFIRREFGSASSPGKEYVRLLTVPTPEGMKFSANTLTKMCPKLYCIDDRTGAVSELILSQMRESALLCGFDVIKLCSPFTGKTEHLIVPELGLGIITSDDLHRFTGDCLKRISYSRFTESDKLRKHKSRINFNINARKELSEQGYFFLGEAKKCREEYLEIYSRSYNRDKIKCISDNLVRELLAGCN